MYMYRKFGVNNVKNQKENDFKVAVSFVKFGV